MRRPTRLWLGFNMAACGATLLALAGCGRLEAEREKEAEGAKAAQAARSLQAGGILYLSQQAQKGVGLVVVPAARRPVRDFVAATGWLVVKPEHEVLVKAPSTGFVLPPDGRETWGLGQSVTKGEDLASLQVLLSPQDQATLVAAKAETDILLKQSAVTMQFAEAQLERLKKATDSVTGTRLAELRETLERARVAHEEARQKLPFLPQEPYGDRPGLKPVPVRSPIAGRLVKIHVSPGQLVIQGDDIWTIADWSSLWARVPIFEGDLARVDQDETARIQAPATEKSYSGKPLKVPQATTAGRRTVDLYYEVDNSSGALRPGQAVSVSLPAGKPSERIVIPPAAVLWDGMGNSWVYVQVQPERFRRQRVEIVQVAADGVGVQRGLKEGEQVVTVGAELLYGEEFRGEIPLGENED